MTTALKRLTLLLAICAQLTLGLGRGMVLCVESDGSIQLELASLACCDPGPVHGHDEETEQGVCSHEDEGCGDCTDRALELSKVPRAKPSLPCLVALPPGLATTWNVRSRVVAHALRRAPPAELGLACLRTTVLRC